MSVGSGSRIAHLRDTGASEGSGGRRPGSGGAEEALRREGERRRCLILAQYYAPEKIGSAPYCTELAEWLAEGGWGVEVVTCRPRYPRADDFPGYHDGSRDDETVNGVAIRRVIAKQRSDGGALARLRSDLSFVARALGLMLGGKLRRADTVVAFVPSILSVLLARLLCRRGGRITAVIHDIESGLAKGLGLITRRRLVARLEMLERFLLNGVSAIVVLTPQMKRALVEIGVTTPVTVLPIWASGATAPPPAAATGRPVTLMYSGNFGRKQGLRQLLDLAERVSRAYPQIRCILQGDGSERASLEKEIAERALGNVEVRGLVPKSALIQSLQEGDIHLVPQDARAANYALPSKIISIMAAGRPIVCTAERSSAPGEIIETSGAGICVPPNDTDALLAAVLKLIENPQLRSELGENGARFVRETLNAPRILGQYESLISSRDPILAASETRASAM
ncbi:MAG: glycosyltransferase family 4 protein [Alphaproteobacteria bacterium]|nr:glycosyltransferase family 4 protein [Alphaproteobacteria bacterium]